MSLDSRVEEWLRKMGYDGQIPASLPKICNPSTAFIWEQLITNVRPRPEVEFKKRCIIANRLSQKPLEQQDEFSYPIKEIQVCWENQRLEKQMKHLEKQVEEKGHKRDELLKRNKTLYATIDNVKKKIKENQEKKYLLEKKSTLLEEEIKHARETLSLAKNLTPVEMDASANADEVAKTLQKCAEKLQKLCDRIPLPKTNTNRTVSASVMTVGKTRKYSSKTDTYSRYLNHSTLSEIAPNSCRKYSDNKENVDHLQHGGAVSRCLKFENGDEKPGKREKVRKTPKRESLGLLPDGCLSTTDDVDEFLLSPSKSENSLLLPLEESVFETAANKSNDIIEKLRSDTNVKEWLKDLLHQNNRYLIVTQWGNMCEDLLRETRIPIMEFNKLNRMNNSIGEDDLLELHFVHVMNELKKDKCRLVLKKLQETVKRKKEDILYQLLSKSRNQEETRRVFELQIEQAYYHGANNFLRKEINSSKKLENNDEIPLINAKIKQVKEEIVDKHNYIQELISCTYKVLNDIKHNREETSHCVRRLNPFIRDLKWVHPMTENIHSEEINLFKQFPLEYNRKFRNVLLKTYYREISDTSVPAYIQLDSNDLEMFTSLIDTPFASAESVIFDILRTKVVLNKLKALDSSAEDLDVNFNTLCPEELAKKEEYLESVINKLSSLINSNSSKAVMSAPNDMKDMIDFWLEMPFRNFISAKRQVDGHGYQYYEKILEELKNSCV